MNKSTFLAFVALASGSIASQAQSRFSHQTVGKSLTLKTARGTMSALNGALPKKAEAASLYMPKHEKTYEYMDGEWMDGGDYYYEYDKRGNILTLTYDDGYTKTRAAITYDDNDMWTEQVTSISEDGGEYVNSERKTRKYDPIVKDLVVELRSYVWQDGQWTVMGNANKRDISRDSRGYVEGMVISTWYDGAFSPLERTTVTMDDIEQPGTWLHERIDENGAWSEEQTLKDMTWASCDGQIVAYDYGDFFAGNNRLKKATAWNGGVQTGLISAVYDETGKTENRTISLTYLKVEGSDEPYGRDDVEYNYTDDNGSFVSTDKYYSDVNGDNVLTDDELTESYKSILQIDDHGNEVLAEEYEGDELIAGTKTERTYDPETDALKETVSSEYDYEAGKYVPMMKIVSDEFVDVTDGIVSAQTQQSVGRTEVYTLSGIKVGDSINGLPAGVYVVKSGNKTFKVVKK